MELKIISQIWQTKDMALVWLHNYQKNELFYGISHHCYIQRPKSKSNFH